VASGGFLLFQSCMLQFKAFVSVSWSMCEGVYLFYFSGMVLSFVTYQILLV
jgi:hypothetical protein